MDRRSFVTSMLTSVGILAVTIGRPMRCPQSRPATISCRPTMTASKKFGGVAGIGGAGIGAAGIGGAGERRRFESRL